MSEQNRLETFRVEKLQSIIDLGHDPYGQRFDGHRPIAEVRPLCPEENGIDGEEVRVAGRIMLKRDTGKLWFVNIKDMTGNIQLMISKNELGDEQWALVKTLDLADIVGVDGLLRKTKTGEISVYVKKLTILTKSIAPPPEKYHGVDDVETLLRHRYLDLIYSDGVLDRMLLRSSIIDSVRQTLRGNRFVEVETPVLHAIAGGAAARPFITHHNALDIQLYMRIALELHLKRLMVGGVERVYEIGRVFRNEGIDATHNPEFTMIEIYQSYGNYETMMDLTEAIVTDAVRAVLKASGGYKPPVPSTPDATTTPGLEQDPERLILPWGDEAIDFTSPWPRKKYADLFEAATGFPMSDHEKVIELAKTKHIQTDNVHIDVIVNKLFEELVEDSLEGPVFVIDYPASICPLTKRKQNDPTIAERFELYVKGMELANAYTELNDPRLQEQLFKTQLDGQAEEDSMAKMDNEFVYALKVGMPPAGGLGIGIDRLVMLLTNSKTIRDVIYFPLMKPEN